MAGAGVGNAPAAAKAAVTPVRAMPTAKAGAAATSAVPKHALHANATASALTCAKQGTAGKAGEKAVSRAKAAAHSRVHRVTWVWKRSLWQLPTCRWTAAQQRTVTTAQPTCAPKASALRAAIVPKAATAMAGASAARAVKAVARDAVNAVALVCQSSSLRCPWRAPWERRLR